MRTSYQAAAAASARGTVEHGRVAKVVRTIRGISLTAGNLGEEMLLVGVKLLG
jgi:hypothetical protein